MNIAIFSDNFYPELGGIQDSVLTLGRALAERGHEVTFCVPSFSERDCRIVHVPFHELHLDERVHVHRFRSIHIPSSTLQSRLVIPTGFRWRVLTASKFDVIHTHTFFGVGLEALMAAKYLHCPLVGTNHWAMDAFDEYFPLNHHWVRSLMLRTISWYYNHCRMVLAPSRSVLRVMEKHGLTVPHDVLSNPIDTRTFSPIPMEGRRALKQKFGLSEATMVFAGRLGMEKNIDVLIRAVAMLRERIPAIMLAIAGHGSYEAQLRSLAKSLGVEQHVQFVGTLSASDLADLFRASEVFTIASTSETQSMTLLQAMACGLPAIGVNSRALPEYIQHDQSGFIVACGDAGAFADRLAELFGDPAKRVAFAARGRALAEQNAPERVIERMEQMYASLLHS